MAWIRVSRFCSAVTSSILPGKHADRMPAGGHGGSDPAMRDNLFRGFTEDPLGQMADTRAGAMSIGIGIAANKSMKEDRAVYLSEFLGKYYTPGKK